MTINVLNSPLIYKNSEYLIKDLNILDFAKQNKTPFYIYDLDNISKKYEELFKFIQWDKLRIFYAMKANYNARILKKLNDIGSSLDTVSPSEVILGLRIGFKPRNIIFTANNMTDEEMHLVKKYDVLFNIDSLSRLEKYGSNYPGSIVCLRFNPEIIAGEHINMQTGGDLTKFGLLLSNIDIIKNIIDKYKLKVIGIHEHTGSGISDSAKVIQSMENILSIATKDNFPDLEFIDFGGGFKVVYSPEEKGIDYYKFGKKITEVFSEHCKNYGKELSLFFEPGKYLVSESGLFILQVNTIKSNKNRLIAGTNSGFSQLIRPMLYGAYHHIVNLSNPQGTPQKYDICGNICETGDLFAKDRVIPEIREGDYLAILNAGAYCYSMGCIYNLRPLPSEYVIDNGRIMLARKAYSEENLIDYIMEQNNNE